MKKTYFLIAILLQTVLVFGQMQFPFDDNFDTYMANSKFVNQVSSTTPWTTWNDMPGGAEDAMISNTFSVTAPNSIKITDYNDVVLKTGNLTTGCYSISFNMYLAKNAVGYINMLQAFGGNNSELGYQIKFVFGEGIIQGNTDASFNYPKEAWFEMKTIIDLDLDRCEIYKDGKSVYEFKWSEGVSATNNKQLAAINFYGWNNLGHSKCEYYIDDVSIKLVNTNTTPTNLKAVIENDNDVKLTWDEPIDASPNGYNIYRDGQKIASTTFETTYVDTNMYPMPYTYIVKALYIDADLSSISSVEVSIPGGVARKSVLVEVFTGTWCVNCPAAARGVDDMHKAGNKVSIIEYHRGDVYEHAESNKRKPYYGMEYLPTAVFDGIAKIFDGSPEGSLFDTYDLLYNQLIEVPSVVDMDLTMVRTGETTYTATISTEETFKYFPTGLKLRIALNESNIEEVWQEVMPELDFVNRDMLEGAEGLDLDFTTQTTHEFTVNFELPVEFYSENCEVIAFVQHDGTKTVVNAVNSALPVDIVGVGAAAENKVALYPNPVQNTLYVTGIENADKIVVSNITGQVIYSGADVSLFANGFNTSGLTPGMYTVIVYEGNEANVLRFVK